MVFGRLGLCHGDGSRDDFTGDYSRFRHLAQDEQFIYCIAASPISSAAVIAIDRQTRQMKTLAGGIAPLPAEQISRPQTLRYPSGSGEAHGFFYPAMTGDTKPPLVVFIHGGPTSACYPMLDPRIQYWAQRGFAVADLNYRGSSGYGRAYRQALHLSWGDVDVEDACAVVVYLADRGADRWRQGVYPWRQRRWLHHVVRTGLSQSLPCGRQPVWRQRPRCARPRYAQVRR
ncbi:alpha/beta hydrolase family protein [Pseudomonas lini]